jgi:uncharacterized membrane protein (DUF106 family)
MAKETEIAESLRQISANLETINQTIKEVCVKSKEVKKNEDREFQLEMLRLQLKYGIIGSVMTILYSAVISYIVATITIGSSIPNIVVTLYIVPLTFVMIASIFLSVVFVACGIKGEITKLRNNFIKSKANDNEQ